MLGPSSREMLASSFVHATAQLDRQRSEELSDAQASDGAASRRRATPHPDTFDPGARRTHRFRRSSEAPGRLPSPKPASPGDEGGHATRASRGNTLEWEDVRLDGLGPSHQMAVVAHAFNALKETDDILGAQLYLAMVGQTMMVQCDRVSLGAARRRVRRVAAEARTIVDEEQDTVSVPSLGPWTRQRGSRESRGSGGETRRASSEQTSPAGSVSTSPDLTPRGRVGRSRRAWRAFCRFLDAGPQTPRSSLETPRGPPSR